MNNLEKINGLLQDDEKLNKYINKIEIGQIETSQIETINNLKENILFKINQKKKNKYEDICKIAACLIFSLAVCRMDFIKNDEIKVYQQKEDKPKVAISINEKISDFCKWATTPIEKEEEEK